MTRPVIWRSADGETVINLQHVMCTSRCSSGSLFVTLASGKVTAELELLRADAQSFLAALDAAAGRPDTAKLDALLERLGRLRGDMASVGGNALVEIVRDLIQVVRP